MWTCPNCKRPFRNANQHHTCKLVSRDEIFDNRPPVLKAIYEHILGIVNTFGEYREEPIPYDVIRLKTKSTFLSVKRKKDHLEVSFFLDHLENIPPVTKYLQTSSRRFVHVVPVDSIEDIDDQLINWMHSSYKLITTA